MPKPSKANETQGQRIERYMQLRGISVHAMRDKAPLTQRIIQMIVNDTYRGPRLHEYVARMAAILDMPSKELLVKRVEVHRMEDLLISDDLLDRFTGGTHDEPFLRWAKELLFTLRNQSLKTKEKLREKRKDMVRK